MKRFLTRSPRSLTTALLLAVLAASPAIAQQLRFATGGMSDRWQVFDPPGQSMVTTTTAEGRVCGPLATAIQQQLCQGQLYPFLGGGANVMPIHADPNATTTTMTNPVAVLSAALSQGGPVNMPLASEWQFQVSGMVPSGVIPGVVSIWTFYDGRNAAAVPGTGKGLASGGGPGNFVFNPLNVTQNTAMVFSGDPSFPTLSWPSGMDPGQTTTPGVTVPTNFPALNPVPTTGTTGGTAMSPLGFGAIYTAGPRQFGGTAAILTDTPNRLTLSFPGGTLYQRTNGKCREGLPFGDCQVGFPYGIAGPEARATSVRRHVNLSNSAIVLGQHGYWHANEWTTGTVTVRNYQPGDDWESFAMSGTDTITASGARHLVLVSPVMNYDRGIGGNQQGGGHIASWDITIQTPEPAAAAGLVAGIGLLCGLHLRARRRG